MSLPVKKWFTPSGSHQKFLAAVLSYGISKKLNRRFYEAVNESHIDIISLQSDIPDVIVYDVRNNLKPILIAEFCDDSEIKSTLRTIEIISEIYSIKESFVVNTSGEKWYRFESNTISLSSESRIFKLDLREVLFHSLHNYF